MHEGSFHSVRSLYVFIHSCNDTELSPNALGKVWIKVITIPPTNMAPDRESLGPKNDPWLARKEG